MLRPGVVLVAGAVPERCEQYVGRSARAVIVYPSGPACKGGHGVGNMCRLLPTAPADAYTYAAGWW
ncbi:hypothetical protein ACFFX0_04950 [Citricoccus parietis]|uniref:Uncharacterized protein n=1 Tax=Citricoccus parietis TaxID=592307 RepID=A0ABV5FVA4_9MICC